MMNSNGLSPEQALAELTLRARAKARTKLIDFVQHIHPWYRANLHHVKLCETLDAFAAGRIKRLMIFAPPRHGKSQLVSRCLPAYLLGRDPDTSVIAASYAADLARQMGRSVQRIVDAPEYRALFPGSTLEGSNIRMVSDGRYLRNADEFEIVGRRGFYKCAGVGGGITGRGFNFGIIDDPCKDAQEAYSKVVRDAVWEWYTQVFLTRQESDASILLTMTRWHVDDLAGRILQSDDAPNWHVVSMSALDAEGRALWPDKFSAEWLEAQRKILGMRSFEALYQQSPIVSGGNMFRLEEFKRYKMRDGWIEFPGFRKRAAELVRFNVADLAYSAKQTADFTVVMSFAADPVSGALFVTDMFRQRIDILASENAGGHRHYIRAQREKAGASYTLVEAKALALRVIEMLQREGEPVSGIHTAPGEDKVARAHAAMPWIEQGMVYLPDDAPWLAPLVEELGYFPAAGTHDDTVDCLVYGVNHWRERCSGGDSADAWTRAIFDAVADDE